jgi:hypothetical protein
MAICLFLQSIYFKRLDKAMENEKWNTRSVNCHSVSRLMHLILPELILTDGYMIAAVETEEENKFRRHITNHSWLITPDGTISDPYPMGVISYGCAVMVPTKANSYHEHLAVQYQK